MSLSVIDPKVPTRELIGPVSKAYHGGFRLRADRLFLESKNEPSVQPNDQLFDGMNFAL